MTGSPDAAPRPLIDRIAEFPAPVLLAVAAAAFLAASAIAMIRESATFDEGTHLAAGYSYWTTGDFRMNPEHPPLLKLMAAAPLLLLDVRGVPSEDPWNRSDEDEFAFKLLYQSGNDPDRLLLWGRISVLVWGPVLLAAVYLESRRRFGPRGALVSLTVVAACPTLLGHGHLITTDVIAAALILLTVCAWVRVVEQPSWEGAVWCGFLLGCALLAKFSAILLLPLVVVIAAAVILRERLSVPPELRGSTARRLACFGILLVAGVGVLWSGYRFRFRPSPDPDFSYDWESLPPERSVTRRAVEVARRAHLLPEAYLYGLARVDDHNSWGHGSFLMGRTSSKGWWWYFPFAFLVKTPVATLVLIGVTTAWWIRRSRREKLADAPLLLPVLMLGLMAVTSRINIGFRHVYPIVPFLAVLCGGAAASTIFSGRRARGLLFFGAGAILECALVAPGWLGYFNAPSRLFAEPREMLVDSNLDWGQDLARLKDYMDRVGARSIKLSYFGTASPRHLGLTHEVLPGFNSYARFEAEWPAARALNPGDLVAISSTNLMGVYLEDPQLYRAWFSRLIPVATVGSSMVVYRIPEEKP
jgi:hypothetical protein